MALHAPHVCWHCSGTISSGQLETLVPGLKSYPVRYQHADEEDCRKSVSQIQYESFGRAPETDAEDMWNGR